MTLNFLTKIGKGAHALCHTSIWIMDPAADLMERVGRICNFVANQVPCPLPKMTFFRWNSVIYTHILRAQYRVYLSRDGKNILTLIAQNIARVGLIILKPRWAVKLGGVAIISRLFSYALSSAVRRSFSAIVENRLIDRTVNLHQNQLLEICADLGRVPNQ